MNAATSMSMTDPTPDDASQASAVADADLSAGQMLRRAREGYGLHLEAVAAALKVTPQKLQALEDDDIAALPDPVFARALAAGVSRALRIDPVPVLAKLPGAPKAAGLAQADRSMSGNISARAGRRWTLSPGLPRPLLAVVVLLLLAAAAVFWLPQSVFDRASAWVAGLSTHQAATAAATEAPPPAPAPAQEASSAATPAPTAQPAPVAAAAPAPAAAEPSASPPAPATAAPASTDDLVLNAARGESWITVRDAGGKVLLQRMVASGETVKLSGTLPLSVVVGRGANVDAQVLGQPLDLASLIKSGGVARFQVKK
jgi:cytoskeleton protein RodZ